MRGVKLRRDERIRNAVRDAAPIIQFGGHLAKSAFLRQWHQNSRS